MLHEIDIRAAVEETSATNANAGFMPSVSKNDDS